MEITGYAAAFFIGILLGLLGGGGSILTVPALVYLLHVNPLLATTSSLFIVGTTSLVGGVRAYMKKLVDFTAVSEFGIPSIFSIFITRHYILPAIPEHLFSIGERTITRDVFLMVLFAVVMLIAACFMVRSREDEGGEPRANNKDKIGYLLTFGIIIGVITGLLGAGGGFLIIPTLAWIMRLHMKVAVGTSLLIIAINSLFGFLFSLKQFRFDWQMLILFTIIAIVGIFAGGKLNDKISGTSLRKFFGWFVLAMAVLILLRELVIFS